MGVNYQITVVPEYSSNFSLETSIRTRFSQLIDGSRYHGNVRIIVFRPTGRPADEFRDNVLPVLRGCNEGVYILAAFSGGYKNISDLVPETENHRVRLVEPIYIQSGELASEASGNHENNQSAFKRMAAQMCREHPGLMIIPASSKKRDKTPESDKDKSKSAKARFIGFFTSSSDKPEPLMGTEASRIPPTKQLQTGGSFDMQTGYNARGSLHRQSSYNEPVNVGGSFGRQSSCKEPAYAGGSSNSERIVLLAGVLHDSPVGLPVQKLAEIMTMRVGDINNIVAQSTVFKRSPISGQEYICLSQKLKQELREMKEGETYKDCMKSQPHSYTPSTTSLAELRSTKDSLDPDILEALDKHFSLDGRLPEILKMALEMFLGSTGTQMDTTPAPSATSRAEPEAEPDLKPEAVQEPEPVKEPESVEPDPQPESVEPDPLPEPVQEAEPVKPVLVSNLEPNPDSGPHPLQEQKPEAERVETNQEPVRNHAQGPRFLQMT